MFTPALNNFINVAAGQLAGQIMQGVAMQFAAGIMASFARPLGAGPLAQPLLPGTWQVSCGNCQLPQPQASWTATTGPGGRGSIDLGEGYRLELNENNSEITVFNDSTGERTRIWGDPHVEIDGKHAFDFWGTTTFTLDNGTKLTINTEQWNGNPNAYVASQVIITRGDQAIVVDGISQNSLGDLSITMGSNGRALDAAHRDGYTLHENGAGAGWLTEMGTLATQAHLDATRIGAEYGPGSDALSIAESGAMLGQFLLFGLLLGSVPSRDSAEPASRQQGVAVPRR
ncbi:MAG: hypothetical protein DCF31_15020 [Alphaproteobacteria bacterium]|nr:MAG: hypothetical protein DCF31_15020 [Alphaproteobacteria bacterium]